MPHPSLTASARKVIQDGEAWTVSNVSAALVQKLRGQGSRITQRARDDCYDAAAIAVSEYQDQCAAEKRDRSLLGVV